MSSGWVKLHRKILDNDIFKNDKLFRVFMYLLLKASHSERDQLIGDSIVNLKAGQWATGRKAISRDTGLTEQNVRTAISKLEKLGILTIKVTVKYSIFSISNWDCYQQDNQQPTNKQPTSNQQVTTINNVKNGKNVKEDIYQQIADAYNEVFPHLPQVVKVSQKRKSHISASINEFKKDFGFDNPNNWKSLFYHAAKSDFLTGRKTDWSMDFDFVINKTNLLKIIEGNYDNV